MLNLIEDDTLSFLAFAENAARFAFEVVSWGYSSILNGCVSTQDHHRTRNNRWIGWGVITRVRSAISYQTVIGY
jgi:hypothetical protein